MRDAIVLSGWTWETFNVPERIALAMSQLGARVLYCENPASFIRRTRPEPREVAPGIVSFQPYFIGQRLNSFSPLRHLQSRMLASQILARADQLGLRDPAFFYFLLKDLLPLTAEMKNKCLLVHVRMDHVQWEGEEHARLSDLTLVIPQSIYDPLKSVFGEIVHLIPQVTDFQAFERAAASPSAQPTALDAIPRPRLGYLGPVHDRLDLPNLSALLAAHPEWHFVSCGDCPALALPNAHVIPWQLRDAIPSCVRALDAGILPYNCADEQQFHCVPLKLFDCFAAGIPVVATPIVHLQEFRDVVYFGSSAAELAVAVEAALREPPDSPERALRIEIARRHSIESLAARLRELLPPAHV
jgi:glycosyltransferase involved in cell wall biosynthesis